MQVGLGPAKGKDFATTLGPWIVTADELEPYRDADGFLDSGARRRSTATRSDGSALQHGLDLRDLIAYASRDSIVGPATCSAQAPSATAAAWPSCGAAAASRTRPRCSPATWSP